VRHALQVSLSRLFGVVELLVAVVAVVLLCRHEARLFSILLNSPPPRLQIFSSISLAPNIDYPIFLPNTTKDALHHEISPSHLPFCIKSIPMSDVGPQNHVSKGIQTFLMHYVMDVAFWGVHYEQHGQLCSRKVSLIPIMHFSKCITKRKGPRLDFRAGL
jgi:hypothetical protein